MTFATLFTTLTTHGLPRAKDCKTALRLLAGALGYPSLEACPVGAACREEATWGKALEDHFQQLESQGRILSAANRRNIRSNLRTVFMLAETHGLLPVPLPPVLLQPPPRLAVDHQLVATSPYRATYAHRADRGYRLPLAAWPPDIAQGWRRYRALSYLRETTLRSYEFSLEAYLGYLAHVAQVQLRWDDMFDPVLITEFVRWHAARYQRTYTALAWNVVIKVAAMAGVLEHPHARALADLRNKLGTPEPLHDKRVHHWISLAELDAVAQASLRAGRRPIAPDPRTAHLGIRRALAFQRGVILALLVRVPLRQRNVREMEWGKHLYQDEAGHWHLRFRGDDLKIGRRGAQLNEYNLDLSAYRPEFIPVLEEWLKVYRPMLPNPTSSRLVFLTQTGNRYVGSSLRVELASTVARYTGGKRFYPHLIRTIWATEFLRATGDFTTAATMLGDTLAVVIKTYYNIVHAEQHAIAADFLTKALPAG